MGIKLSTLVPRYFRDFNIENRVMNQIENIEKTGRMAPRHPSTAHIFKEIEESTPTLDERNINKLVIERSKEVKVFTNEMTTERATNEVPDKRPKKINEIVSMFGEKKYDLDWEKYGYTKPEKIRPGNITLRQFDEMINEYRANKSAETIKKLSQTYNLDTTNLHILLEYYKPLYRINKSKEAAEQNDTIIGNVFPNVNLLKSEAQAKSQ